MSYQISKRALKKAKTGLGNRDYRKGTPEKIVGKGLGLIGTFEQETKSCDKR